MNPVRRPLSGSDHDGILAGDRGGSARSFAAERGRCVAGGRHG